jgi:hypothetical protein
MIRKSNGSVSFFTIWAGMSVFLFFSALSCASAATGAPAYSEIVVRRVDSNSAVKLRVFVDGKAAGSLKVGNTATYKIKNGVHTIYATAYDYSSRSTEVSQFTSNGSRHVFSITDTSIVFVGEEPVNSAVTASLTTRDPLSLDSTVLRSFDGIANILKKGTKIAIINVAADNSAEGFYVIEELTQLAVRSPKKFTVIDRRKLEAIRIAKNFDRTSDMEDDFVLSIGHLLGADVVLTGSMAGYGSLRRLRVKALDVKSGVLLAMSSERL